MVLPRRGGPSGRCHSWVSLSKRHAELRKLIPIYFPSSSLSSVTDSPTNSVEVNTSDTTPKTSPVPNESPSSKELSSIGEQEKENAGSTRQTTAKKASHVWNIDEEATNKLHNLINLGLVFKSLSVSAVQWKSIPQIRGFTKKHCAAVCGVIIKKKRHKSKRIKEAVKKSGRKLPTERSDGTADERIELHETQEDTVPDEARKSEVSPDSTLALPSSAATVEPVVESSASSPSKLVSSEVSTSAASKRSQQLTQSDSVLTSDVQVVKSQNSQEPVVSQRIPSLRRTQRSRSLSLRSNAAPINRNNKRRASVTRSKPILIAPKVEKPKVEQATTDVVACATVEASTAAAPGTSATAAAASGTTPPSVGAPPDTCDTVATPVVEKPPELCRFCHRSLQASDSVSRRICACCRQLLRNFSSEYQGPKDLACLRDTPCFVQRISAKVSEPIVCNDTARLEQSDFKPEQSEQEDDSISESWCVPCKVSYCVKHGFKLKGISEDESESREEEWFSDEDQAKEKSKMLPTVESEEEKTEKHEEDDSATEPEMDEVRAEKMIIPASPTKIKTPKTDLPILPQEQSVTSTPAREQELSPPPSPSKVATTALDGQTVQPASSTLASSESDLKEQLSSRRSSESKSEVDDDGQVLTEEVETSNCETTTGALDNSGESDGESAAPTSPEPEATCRRAKKRKSLPPDPLIVRGKRRLKINHRFLDDFDSVFPSLTGSYGREVYQDRSYLASEDGGGGGEVTLPTVVSHRTRAPSSSSWFARRHGQTHHVSSGGRSHHHLHHRHPDRTTTATTTSRGRITSRRGRQPRDERTSESLVEDARPTSGLGPRVKQVSRPAIRTPDNKYSSTMSAMIHAARLAAVGAKIPGGTSPSHAALAATSKSPPSDPGGRVSGNNFQGENPSPRATSAASSGGVSGNSKRLSERCGQCPVCIGLVQPCGRCANCISREQTDGAIDLHAKPCKELICFRRRADHVKSGPRIKLPSNFSPSASALTPLVQGQRSDETTGFQQLSAKSTEMASCRQIQPSTEPTVTVFDTVPRLAQQLEMDAWLSHPVGSGRDNGNGSMMSGRSLLQHNKLHVHADKLLTPIPGGDLGMRFNGNRQTQSQDADQDRIRPVEGEVVTSELANHGGYAIVTTMASAPPKEICYACGSGGGQLLFCVSCAEPFHFYCVERQFRPRRKDHFICRNCTECQLCHQPAADLRCTRCSMGYHPSCLPDYPPAQTSQRGNWVCPNCTSCLHCGAKPQKPNDPGKSPSATIGNHAGRQSPPPHVVQVPWSSEVGKCAACSLAEARGDVCPECDRAYLPTAKQMIQCDGCHLWMHRTCMKLTADEYEYIARMPTHDLTKFVVNCTVCQNEKKQQSRPLTDANKLDRISPSGTEDADTDSLKLSGGSASNGASRLRTVARDTLMERMAGLVTNLRQPPAQSPSPTAESQMPPLSSTHRTRVNSGGSNCCIPMSPSVFQRRPSGGIDSTSARRVPQLDGTFDLERGEEDNEADLYAKGTKPINPGITKYSITASDRYSLPPCSRASDVLLYDSPASPEFFPNTPKISPTTSVKSFSDHTDFTGTGCRHKKASKPSSSASSMSRPSLRVDTEADRFPLIQNSSRSVGIGGGGLSPYPPVNSRSSDDWIKPHPSYHGHYEPNPGPPIAASWLVQDESDIIWTTPRSLLYRLLTQVLSRLSAHPVNSNYALSLRRLLRWLSSITESLFPWLNLSDMASDVRDVLRQTNGGFEAVLKHFDRLALIELQELVCPVVARLTDTQLRSRLSVGGISALNSVSNVSYCHSVIGQHIKAHHPTAVLLSPKIPAHLSGFRDIINAKSYALHCQPSHCHRPHELEAIEKMRNDTREERWVEHWSAIEEEMVLQHFQRHLLKTERRSSVINNLPAKTEQSPPHIKLPTPPESPTPAPHEEPLCPVPPTESSLPCIPPGTLDEAFKDMDSVLEAVQRDDEREHPHVALVNLAPSADITMLPELDEAGKKTPTSTSNSGTPVHVDPRDRFYFALDEFWTAAMGAGRSNAPAPATVSTASLDLDSAGQENEPRSETRGLERLDDETDSSEEDNRCCLLCAHHGDNNIEGRLLFTGADTWVHVNCALWSNEVYEEESGQLIGLSDALRRGRSSVCLDCGRYGATMICANAHESTCPLYVAAYSTRGSSDEDSVSSLSRTHRGVHFACALRRRPPSPRSVFTADRSWFCSPGCHESATRQRLLEAVQLLRSKRIKQSSKGLKRGSLLLGDSLFDDPLISRDEYADLENSVADDLEPISLGELLVCRRVFVPSDCFAASLHSFLADRSPQHLYAAPDDSPKFMSAAHDAVTHLAVSPNSLAFLQCTGLPAASLVVTVGSLRVDRLGEVREASDALASAKTGLDQMDDGVKRANFLCPIGYRARRIYWSCTKLDARISYTLHVRQTHTIGPIPTYDLCASRSLARPLTINTSKSLLDQPEAWRPSNALNNLLNLPVVRPKPPLISFPMNKSNTEDRLRPLLSHVGTNHSSITFKRQQPVSEAPLIGARSFCSMPAKVSGVDVVSARTPYQPAVTVSIPGTAAGGMRYAYNNPPISSVTSVAVGNGLETVRPFAKPSLRAANPMSIPSATRFPIASSVRPAVSVTVAAKPLPAPTQPRISAVMGNVSLGSLPGCYPATKNSTSDPVRIIHKDAFMTSSRSQLNSSTVHGNLVEKIVQQPSKTPLLPASSTNETTSTTRTPLLTAVPVTPVSVCLKNVVGPRVDKPVPIIPIATKPGSTIQVTGRTGSVIRIRNASALSHTRILTTPTKDLQLASQLNGLFQSLPRSPTPKIKASYPASYTVQLVRGQSASQVVETNVPQHTVPQLDGTLDDDDDRGENRPMRRSRSFVRHHRSTGKRSSSFSSNNSSSSNRTNRSSASRSATSRSRGEDLSRRGHQKRYLKDSPLVTSPNPPVKRRWIEERSRQQELAHLVSKAKQANHSRMYQSEVEKHTRSFRLRFAVEGVVRAAANPAAAWRTVVQRVIALRQKHGLQPLVCGTIDGWAQFGLSHRHVLFLIEQMRGAFQCYRYRFQYHWRKIERLRQKFTAPVPLVEGCARALMWTKPHLAAHQARDPLSFLGCKANVAPRPMLKPGQTVSSAQGALPKIASVPSANLSPGESVTLLSPNEQAACAEAARQAATLVAVQLKLPLRVREEFIARAVVKATGLPIKPKDVVEKTDTPSTENTANLGPTTRSATNMFESKSVSDSDEEGAESEDESEGSTDDEEEQDLGTIAAQYDRLLSGPLARLLRVSVHPSRIHGRGLFALRRFREDEMVIEYTGELIRSIICELREVRYRAAGVDCYMFRIDEDWVIDATYAGNAARFINHSCEPNCYAKIITVDDRKHIVILAQRRQVLRR
ncbi:unnamed protein product [Calicophoron daubneyi]|uniref:Uncharacterized protein n=1 Tax=Calicophoron daubneyi TaxID=300641 RepID=A0AAV2TY60_CALDB